MRQKKCKWLRPKCPEVHHFVHVTTEFFLMLCHSVWRQLNHSTQSVYAFPDLNGFDGTYSLGNVLRFASIKLKALQSF